LNLLFHHNASLAKALHFASCYFLRVLLTCFKPQLLNSMPTEVNPTALNRALYSRMRSEIEAIPPWLRLQGIGKASEISTVQRIVRFVAAGSVAKTTN